MKVLKRGYKMETMLIQLKVKTANALKDLRITERESYDEIIKRLLENVPKPKKVR